MAQCLFSYLFTFGVYLQLCVYVHVGGCTCVFIFVEVSGPPGCGSSEAVHVGWA